MILDTLADAAKKRVETLKSRVSLRDMEAMAYKAYEQSSKGGKEFIFEQTMASPSLSFICEVKRASPSKGLIAEDFPYVTIGKEYEEAGADAISVLTEPDYFLGKDEYLTEISHFVNLPLLRKDFTVDPYQIYEAKVLGASAVLLICALLDTKKIREWIKICDRLSMSALVEAHDEQEIDSALEAGARLIGVNNRNLKTFTVDLKNSLRLRNRVPQTIPFIAESGIKTPDDIRLLSQAGVNGVLIGESLMRSPNKKQIIRSFQEAL